MECTRRQFLKDTLSCATVVAMGLAGASKAMAQQFAMVPYADVVGTEPFGRVEKLAEGVWATVATPFSQGSDNPQRQLTSNGGIIAGPDAVICIEGFMTPAGAAWQSAMAEQLTGRRPTHVVVTHYHADHCTGLCGYQRGAEGPGIYATAKTRELLRDRLGENPTPSGDEVLVPANRRVLLPDQVIIELSEEGAGGIDLGDGRKLWFRPRRGHTDSDLVLELSEPRVTWCGDLVFNGLYPVCRDATPSALLRNTQELISDPEVIYVPGHGSVSDKDGLAQYLGLLDHLNETAQAALEKGLTLDEAVASYQIPDSLGEWRQVMPNAYRMAMEAWYREARQL